MSSYLVKKTVDEYLDEVDFGWLNSGGYVPSKFALEFLAFIKLVNGKEGEENVSPTMHLAMLDKIAGRKRRLANLCHRGSGKSTLIEYLIFFIAVFGNIPNFGEINGMLFVGDAVENGVKSLKESIEARYNRSEFLQAWLPVKGVKFTERSFKFKNKNGKAFAVECYGGKSGLRGRKIGAMRPEIAVMDDLVSDEDSKSQIAMQKICHTVHSGVEHALHPDRFKMILNGTPFNKEDVVYKAIESGAWDVSVWPVCEQFPCTKKEFNGSWEDRFTYDTVKEKWDSAVMQGVEKSFRQELMLRITDDESRLVHDADIGWVSIENMLSNPNQYNFYITTDFGISSKQTADFTVLAVWAFDKDGNWTWVDGVVNKQTMDTTMNDLFRLVQRYNVMGVAIEISGQQGGYIPWIISEMNHRNIYFNLTQEKGKPGIRPVIDKLSRFQLAVPLFKLGKMRWPIERKQDEPVRLFMEQISLATRDGIKGKDDCLDAISQIPLLNAWKPSPNEVYAPSSNVNSYDPLWGPDEMYEQSYDNNIDSYLV